MYIFIFIQYLTKILEMIERKISLLNMEYDYIIFLYSGTLDDFKLLLSFSKWNKEKWHKVSLSLQIYNIFWTYSLYWASEVCKAYLSFFPFFKTVIINFVFIYCIALFTLVQLIGNNKYAILFACFFIY